MYKTRADPIFIQEVKAIMINTSKYIIKILDDVKPIIAVGLTGVNYVLFPDEAFATALLGVGVAVILDIITKYIAISKQCGGFRIALRTGKIYSKTFWEGTSIKIVSYLTISILAGISYRVVLYKGASIFLSTFVYSMMFLRESHSIIENLIEAGSDLHWLLVIVKKKESNVLNEVKNELDLEDEEDKNE